MRRHPEISVRKVEGISVSRAQGMNKEETPKYFDLLKKTLMENNLVKKPGHISNSDETGLQLNKPSHVLAKKGSTDVHLLTSREKGETVSDIACCSAEGHFLPPVCTFKGVNKEQEFEDGLPSGSAVIMPKKSAHVTSEVFMTWLKDHLFHRKLSGEVLNVLDGNSSHVNDNDILDFANENYIVLLCLPSHSTNNLQPLDKSFFLSL
jgi:hypothetical protein